jgi:hypothetical protein
MFTTGFHAGEVEVQNRAGVRAIADSQVGMLNPADLHDGMIRFLARSTFAPMAGRDPEGRLWVTALEGAEGFLDAGPDWLRMHSAPRKGDPLHGLPVGQSVGLIAMEFASRRRFRLNGMLAAAGADFLEIALDQAFGNCPKYIHPRTLQVVAAEQFVADAAATPALSADQEQFVRGADTLFLGTTHPQRGNDVSHKAGPAGFVEVRDGALWWPDFIGNDMFNSLGNLTVDDTAAVWLADFHTGRTLHLSGRATVEWDAVTDTGRAVRFAVEAARWGVPLLQREA